jgi:hypothetical protein
MTRCLTQLLAHKSARKPDGTRNQPYAQCTMAGMGMSKSVDGKSGAGGGVPAASGFCPNQHEIFQEKPWRNEGTGQLPSIWHLNCFKSSPLGSLWTCTRFPLSTFLSTQAAGQGVEMDDEGGRLRAEQITSSGVPFKFKKLNAGKPADSQGSGGGGGGGGGGGSSSGRLAGSGSNSGGGSASGSSSNGGGNSSGGNSGSGGNGSGGSSSNGGDSSATGGGSSSSGGGPSASGNGTSPTGGGTGSGSSVGSSGGPSAPGSSGGGSSSGGGGSSGSNSAPEIDQQGFLAGMTLLIGALFYLTDRRRKVAA